MEQKPSIQNEEFNDIIIEQENSESNPENQNIPINDNNAASASGKFTLESCLIKNGIFLPEDKFISEIYFKNEAMKDIETYMADIISTAFKENSLNFIVINAAYLRKNTEYRKMIHSYIDEKHTELKSVSVGYKDYMMFCRKNKFLEFIQSVPKDQMQNAFDFIFLKLFSFNMRENNMNNLDKEELKELYEGNEEGADKIDYEELQRKKSKRLRELAEEEEKNKQICLPILKKFQMLEIKDTSVKIKLPDINVDSIVDKNRINVRGFRRIYENTKISYIVFLFDYSVQEFKEYLISEQSTITISNLQSSRPHLVKFSVKFDKYISKPSKTFIFYTKNQDNVEKSSIMSYITWGNNKNSRLFVNEEYKDKCADKYITLNCSTNTEVDSIKSIATEFSDIDINNSESRLDTPSRLRNNSVTDYCSYYDVTYLLLSTGEVVSSGKTFAKNAKDSGDFNLEFDESKVDECRLFYSNPFTVSFPWGVHIRKVGCGLDFCVCLDIEGNIYTWGVNDFGQLGQNIPKDVIINNPKKIAIRYENYEDNVYVTDFHVGSKHCLASVYINEKIKLFSWGFGQGCEPIVKADDYAFTGMRIKEKILKLANSFSPLLVKFSYTDKIIKIIASFNQNAIICKEKSINVLYTFGETINHQLGYSHTFLGSVNYWGVPSKVDFFADNNLSVLDVSYSDNHSLFLVKNSNTDKNEVYCCGINSNRKFGVEGEKFPFPIKINFELANDDNLSQINPVKISAGKNHSLILTDNNQLVIIGKTDINSNIVHKNLIRKVNDLTLRPTDKVIKLDCLDDNITLLLKQNLN